MSKCEALALAAEIERDLRACKKRDKRKKGLKEQLRALEVYLYGRSLTR